MTFYNAEKLIRKMTGKEPVYEYDEYLSYIYMKNIYICIMPFIMGMLLHLKWTYGAHSQTYPPKQVFTKLEIKIGIVESH